MKRILKLPTTLGLGFDPTAIEPESGFKPIVEGQGGSIPSLAFSVMDGAERPPIRADLYENDFLQRRQDILDQLVVNQLTHVRLFFWKLAYIFLHTLCKKTLKVVHELGNQFKKKNFGKGPMSIHNF